MSKNSIKKRNKSDQIQQFCLIFPLYHEFNHCLPVFSYPTKLHCLPKDQLAGLLAAKFNVNGPHRPIDTKNKKIV